MGYVLVDTFIIIVHAAKLYSGSCAEQHVKFQTSDKQIYQRRITSVGTDKSQLLCIRPQEMQRLYAKRKELGIETEVQFGIKPQFHTFDDDIDDEKTEEEEDQIGTMNKSEMDELKLQEVVVCDDLNGLKSEQHIIANHEVPIVADDVIDVEIKVTTPSLNAAPIPSNTVSGRLKLRQNVQCKMNKMMQIEAYILDARWSAILKMSAFDSYNAQKSVWLLMKNLENEKIKELIARRQQQQRIDYNNVIEEESPLTPIRDICTHRLVNDFDKTTPNGTKVTVGDGIYGIPVLSDKSKYKCLAIQFCQKMGWNKPNEYVQFDSLNSQYRATVTFGRYGREKSASGQGKKQKIAIYEAYIKLLPVLIPKEWAMEAISKWIPGKFGNVDNLKKENVQNAEPVFNATPQNAEEEESQPLPTTKHPKSILLEWAQKHSIAPPKTVFFEFADLRKNVRIWTAKVTFCGKTIESKGTKKKDAEQKCFAELLKHVMNGGISQQ